MTEYYGGAWKELNATMPFAAMSMAVGYWNGIITLIGGYSLHDPVVESFKQVVSFDVEQQKFGNITPTNIRYGVSSGIQFYTQVDESVYMIQDGEPNFHISQFNLSNGAFNESFVEYPFKDFDYATACLASSKDYLFVISDNEAASSSMYQFSTKKWFHQNMTTRRDYTACAVYDGYVYAIGGINASVDIIGSIERMKISNGERKWETMNYSLPIPVRMSFAVPIDDGILVIGGMKEGGIQIATIQVMSFDATNAINGVNSSSFPALKTAVNSAGIIKADNQLFAFGGQLNDFYGPSTNRSQVYEFIETSQPTLSPTASPTDIPSDGPSLSPTASPTESPTDYPSDGPSLLPTASPTDNPSDGPSLSPTAPPTEETDEPTVELSDAPTKSPVPKGVLKTGNDELSELELALIFCAAVAVASMVKWLILYLFFDEMCERDRRAFHNSVYFAANAEESSDDNDE